MKFVRLKNCTYPYLKKWNNKIFPVIDIKNNEPVINVIRNNKVIRVVCSKEYYSIPRGLDNVTNVRRLNNGR